MLLVSEEEACGPIFWCVKCQCACTTKEEAAQHEAERRDVAEMLRLDREEKRRVKREKVRIERWEKLRLQYGSCEKCGAPMRLVTKYGTPFLACANYRHCRWTAMWQQPTQNGKVRRITTAQAWPLMPTERVWGT